jgi:hypothetical protein
MNKRVAAMAAMAVVIVAVGAVAGSAYSGHRVRTRMDAQLAQASAQLPFLKVVSHRSDGGVFTSTRTVTYQIGCATGAGPVQPLVLTQHDIIRHGPLPGFRAFGAARIDTTLSIPPDVSAEMARLFGDRPPLTIRTAVGFDGRFESRFESPQGAVSGPQGQQLNWHGLTGTLASDADMSFARYEFNMPGMELTDSAHGTQVSMSNVRMRGEGRGVGPSLWLMPGSSEGEIGSIVMRARMPAGGDATGGEMLRMQFDNLKVVSEATLEQDLLSARSSMTGSGSFNATRLDKVEMVASIARLHVPSYQKLLTRLWSDGVSCGAEPPPEQVLQALQQELLPLLPFNPQYSLDRLVVELDGRRGEFAYSVGVAGVTPDDLRLPPQQLFLSKGTVRASARVPRAWVEKLLAEAPADGAGASIPFGAVFEQARAMGYVSEDAGHLSTSFQFGGGEVRINGRPLGTVPAGGVH